jgi:hypothetical protein
MLEQNLLSIGLWNVFCRRAGSAEQLESGGRNFGLVSLKSRNGASKRNASSDCSSAFEQEPAKCRRQKIYKEFIGVRAMAPIFIREIRWNLLALN